MSRSKLDSVRKLYRAHAERCLRQASQAELLCRDAKKALGQVESLNAAYREDHNQQSPIAAQRLQDIARYLHKTHELIDRQRSILDSAVATHQQHLNEARNWLDRVEALDKLLNKRQVEQHLHLKRLARKS